MSIGRRPRAILVLLVLTIGFMFPPNSFPGVLPARAVVQSGPTTWRPYGPHTPNLNITVYSDADPMFQAFIRGQVDITDWPVDSTNIMGFGGNADFFLTSQQQEFGIAELAVNHHASFMGVSMQVARPVPPVPGVVGGISYGIASGCGSGFGRFIVNLVNKETGNSAIIDPYNTLIGTGPGTPAPVTDDPAGGTVADGQYVLPGPTSCMLQGSYSLRTSIYGGTVAVSLCLNQVCAPNAASVQVTLTLGLDYNSPSTLQPTQAGTEIRKAISHLLDKPSFGSLMPSNCDDTFLAGSGCPGILAPLLSEDCSAHPWLTPCSPVSAYNLVSDTIAGGARWWSGNGASAGAVSGYSGVEDLRGACDHLVLAGFALAPAGSTCADVASASMGIVPPGAYPHLVAPSSIVFYIMTDQPQKAFGQIFADSLNFLFGTPGGGTVLYGSSTVPSYFTTNQISDIVFSSSVPDDWNLYTGQSTLGSTPDHLFNLFHSSFATTTCGGPALPFPSNYRFYCDPNFDTQSAGGEFAPTLVDSSNIFADAAVIGFRTVMSIPVLSRLVQHVALDGWNFQPTTEASLVSVLGHGFGAGNGYWSALNMHQNLGFISSDSRYVPGGGDPTQIRRAFSQKPQRLSPFHAITPWELETVGLVYDSLLRPNPLTGGGTTQIIDWMTTKHSQVVGSRPGTCVPVPPTAPPGTLPVCSNTATTQTWTLRTDLRFHDGSPVTVADVAFSVQAYRDVPSDIFRPNVAAVAEINVVNPNTLQVILLNQSPFYELNIGGLPIVEKGSAANPNSWVSKCTAGGVIGGAGNACVTPGDDPMSTGRYVGSGPWVCSDLVTGTAGGSCVENPTGPLPEKIHLGWFDRYMRGPVGVQGTSLEALSWADINDDGIDSILDLGSVTGPSSSGALAFYWDHPLYGTIGTVDTHGDVKIVGYYFDHGLTGPFTSTSTIGLDKIDPFQAGSLYYLGTVRQSTGILVYLANLGSAPISGTLTSHVAGSTNSTAFTIPAMSRVSVPFQLSPVTLVQIGAALSTGESLSFNVPIWMGDPPPSPSPSPSVNPSPAVYLDFYRMDWSDVNNDGWVTILDISQTAGCFDTVPGTGGPLCSGAAADYWDLNVSGKVDITDIAIVAFFFDQPLHPWLRNSPFFSPFPGAGHSSSHFDPRWNCNLLPAFYRPYCTSHS